VQEELENVRKLEDKVARVGLNEGGNKMKKFVETLEGMRSKKVGGRDLQELGRLVRVLGEVQEELENVRKLEDKVARVKEIDDGIVKIVEAQMWLEKEEKEWKLVKNDGIIVRSKEEEEEIEVVEAELDLEYAGKKFFQTVEMRGWHIEKR
jgi:hypothetical protein